MTNCVDENDTLMDQLSFDNTIVIPLDKKSQEELQQQQQRHHNHHQHHHYEDELNFDQWNVMVQNIHIDFNDLTYSVRTTHKGSRERQILREVNGYFRASSLNAIIGPSGAGKSSLINAICGIKTTNVRGVIRVNGIPMPPDIMRKIVCYIPQEFALLPCLTTQETLYFAARLKIPRSYNKSFESIVKEVADKLGLLDSFNTMAKQLSGGEKKRLAIAVEVVVKPLVLILDEPTSGLDSIASSQVIGLLKSMSHNGCTVVCTIHQPSSQMMTMFDDILVITEGRDIYCGPQSSIIETFERAGFICPSFYNIGEFVIEVATGQRTGDIDELRNLCKQFPMSPLINSNVNVNDSHQLNGEKGILGLGKDYFERRAITWVTELGILLWRAVICIRRDCTMTQIRLVAHILIGFLLGLVFHNFGNEASKTFSNIACLFFFLLFLFFANAMPAVQMFPIEAAVFAREHSNNWYNLRTYYIAKIITDLPLQILCPSFFLIIAYSLTGQPLEMERFIKVWCVCFLLSILAQSFGILTGAAFNTHIGCFLVPALNIPMFLFAGFFLKLNEIPSYLQTIRTLSFFRYAFEGVLQAIYGGERKILKCTAEFCMFRSPKLILSHMDMPSTTFTMIIVALLTWILCLHVLIYIILRWKFLNIK